MGDSLEEQSIIQPNSFITSILNGYYKSFNRANKLTFLGEKFKIQEPIINILDSYARIFLSWENYPKEIYDLDLSVISFDKKNKAKEIINYKNLESSDNKILHQGDSKIGMVDIENEVIHLNLNMNENINSLAVVINSFKGYNFCGLKSASIKLFYNGINIRYYNFEKEIEATGLLFGFFRRDFKNHIWQFHVKNYPLTGTDALQTIPQLIEILNTN